MVVSVQLPHDQAGDAEIHFIPNMGKFFGRRTMGIVETNYMKCVDLI